jgi:hypothetical protein
MDSLALLVGQYLLSIAQQKYNSLFYHYQPTNLKISHSLSYILLFFNYLLIVFSVFKNLPPFQNRDNCAVAGLLFRFFECFS